VLKLTYAYLYFKKNFMDKNRFNKSFEFNTQNSLKLTCGHIIMSNIFQGQAFPSHPHSKGRGGKGGRGREERGREGRRGEGASPNKILRLQYCLSIVAADKVLAYLSVKP
jgi:hypothetical protein